MEKSKYVVFNSKKNCYWVDKTKITGDINKASKYNSLEEVVKNVPIFLDWNIDYNIYKIKGDKMIELVEDKKWMRIHFHFSENEPDKKNELYKNESTIIIEKI